MLHRALCLPFCCTDPSLAPAGYHIVFLKRDPARKSISPVKGERIQSANVANIQSMGDRGVLVAAGPFDDTPPVISGVFFATSTIEEARTVAEADSTVLEHRNTVDVLALGLLGALEVEWKDRSGRSRGRRPIGGGDPHLRPQC